MSLFRHNRSRMHILGDIDGVTHNVCQKSGGGALAPLLSIPLMSVLSQCISVHQ